VVDFAERKEVGRVQYRAKGEFETDGARLQAPSTPGDRRCTRRQKGLWVTSIPNNARLFY